MKRIVVIIVSMLLSCTSSDVNSTKKGSSSQSGGQTEICWKGTINDKIPVFVHYSVHDKVIAGEITYLNTKNRTPIKLLGTITEDTSYRLLEFGPDGNISGVIVGTPGTGTLNGTWTSPVTGKELRLNLSRNDTVINSANILPNKNEVYGDYHYQYGEKGYMGDFEMNRISETKASFRVLSVTRDPARNIADVPTDTIAIQGNSFVYKIPDSDSCEFRVTFYKGFVAVDYTKGYCDDQFGMGATIDGIYLKTGK